MAADFIPLIRGNSANIFVNDLIGLPQQLRAVVDKLEKVRDTGFRMFETGPPADFSEFETFYGIPTGQGQTVFDLVNGTLNALGGTAQNANSEEFMNRVG